MTRYYVNIAARPTRAEVIAEVERMRGLASAGYYAADGWRCAVEITPEAAMEMAAARALQLQQQAAALEAAAERMRP